MGDVYQLDHCSIRMRGLLSKSLGSWWNVSMGYRSSHAFSLHCLWGCVSRELCAAMLRECVDA